MSIFASLLSMSSFIHESDCTEKYFLNVQLNKNRIVEKTIRNCRDMLNETL
jgi:hypothetical protein